MASASSELKQKTAEEEETGSNSGSSKHGSQKQSEGIQNIPTTFKEMFQFNAAVMGFGQNLWMNEVLDSFNNIMSNFANVGRVQEECYVLTIRIAKVATGKVNLPEFRSCMLASLRSLLPKEWSTAHELAWSWSWERVEQFLLENMGRTQKWEKALDSLLEGIDEATGYQLRQDIYARFFTSTPAGESYFKQNVTYLHLLVTKVLGLCITMYKDPVYCVDDISGIGFRHVGYGIPTELFQPFIIVICGVVRDLGVDEVSLKAFTWVLNLIWPDEIKNPRKCFQRNLVDAQVADDATDHDDKGLEELRRNAISDMTKADARDVVNAVYWILVHHHAKTKDLRHEQVQIGYVLLE